MTPLWPLTTQEGSAALVELPVEEPCENVQVTMALRSLKQPNAQVCEGRGHGFR